ncbi:MAG: hypothetical protein QS748_04770 [Candidatus Endonucleobacter bathymodioli]|uniref:Uncharacterized protein n=1 Tax=Candidatus Endonucleibacter bathymodioli TaxID=539814 RepID=A0AA90SSJ1_9GAMM|nr:hypothetical protein [Candidatus Endonucleobacter bathymodioli]
MTQKTVAASLFYFLDFSYQYTRWEDDKHHEPRLLSNCVSDGL